MTLARPGRKPRLLLVGIGHANLQILERMVAEPLPDVDLVAVSLSDKHHYSGMVPGYIRGGYREDQIAFDLPNSVAAAGGKLIQSPAVGIDLEARTVALESGQDIEYDLVSFNLGSRAAGQDSPGIGENAVRVKPMSQAVSLKRALVNLRDTTSPEAQRVAVVGAGAAGFEIACGIAEFLDVAGRAREVELIESADRILSGYTDRLRRKAEKILAQKGIHLHLGSRVAAVSPQEVELENGSRIPSNLTVWLTGATADPMFQGSGLDLDDRGFVLVDDSLRSVSDSRVFAVGDCATMVNYPDTPKAGVYSVRQGPVLWRSLLAAINGTPPPRYKPQSGFLSILNTCDGRSLLQYKGMISHGRWAWWLKDRIDRGFMAKYQRLEPPPSI
jgi:selenide,water dikinase